TAWWRYWELLDHLSNSTPFSYVLCKQTEHILVDCAKHLRIPTIPVGRVPVGCVPLSFFCCCFGFGVKLLLNRHERFFTCPKVPHRLHPSCADVVVNVSSELWNLMRAYLTRG
uniref:Uncharacterized protein n=1 Tax=Anopheles atroparvus TaxID=41427 RepID=A0AAG5CRT7_ANOAO